MSSPEATEHGAALGIGQMVVYLDIAMHCRCSWGSAEAQLKLTLLWPDVDSMLTSSRLCGLLHALLSDCIRRAMLQEAWPCLKLCSLQHQSSRVKRKPAEQGPGYGSNHTMRFGSTAKVLLKCKLKYYRISE